MKAYLDIETDREGNVCVIGIFCRPGGFVQFYGDDVTADNLEGVLGQAKTIVTFNGDRFDLPMLEKYFNIDLKGACSSLDLFKVKKNLGLRGGLKQLEKMYGIKRKTEGIDGYKAMLLWERYVKKGQTGALKLLLEYNKEDVINLITLEEIFFRQMKEMRHGGAV
ncbi:MAG: ribonuclease H-like domain-containing protein [Syntrophorhabdales bacterium]|jgi:uncharacterized protein YprB with RNaseH-like and TPR domain